MIFAVAVIGVLQCRVQAGVGPVPQWIWCDALPYDQQAAAFYKAFEIDDDVQAATLECLADDLMSVWLNGVRVGEVSEFRKWASHDVRTLVRRGRNTLMLVARNVRGPAGVCVRLHWQDSNRHRHVHVTDPSWRSIDRRRLPPSKPLEQAAEVAAEWPRAVSVGLVGIQPWGDPTGEAGDYYQWKKALGAAHAESAAAIRVVPGFEVELIRSARENESSWISLTFDPQGRIVIGREGRDRRHGLVRLTLSQDGGEPVAESIEETLLEPRGLTFRNNDLFANANNAHELVRVRDADGDGRFEEVTSLHKSPGSVGHGRNNIAFGPDGRLYSIHGNDVRLPEDFDAAWSFCRPIEVDRLLPCRWDFLLFDRQAKLPAGHLIRTNEKGHPWELVAGGFRNPYGIDFNTDGELFTFDADNEGDLGLPWYRPTRINQIVSGGDYGWRQGTAMRPAWYPDSLPSNLNIGKSSPTDIKFGTRSSFPQRYRESLFILDWSYGRIYALQMQPRGASYTASAECFLEGRPLNVTDLEFGPDGALYFTTGGRGTQSGLYRVRYAGPEELVSSPECVTPAEAQAAEHSRAVRRTLEAFHNQQDARAITVGWPFLGDSDPWIRHAARIAIEFQPVATWRERALSENDPLAAATALMALARCSSGTDQINVLRRLNQQFPPLQTHGSETLLIALRAYQLSLIRAGMPDPEVAGDIRRSVEGMFPFGCGPIDQLACELLVFLKAPHVVSKTMALLQQASTQEEKLLWLFELRNVRQPWTLAERRAFLRELSAAETFEGGREVPVALFSIGAEFRETLGPDEQTALADLLGKENTADVGTSLLPQRPLVREWKLDELAGRLDEIGRLRDFDRGQRVFQEANCLKCHRFAKHGKPIGPDLEAVGFRFGRRDLLETILVPSKVIDEKYRDVTFELKSGRVVTGRVVGGDDESILVSANAASPFQTVTVQRSEIESQRPSPLSPMPVGLLNTHSAEEILDLLAYLESNGDRHSAVFQRGPTAD